MATKLRKHRKKPSPEPELGYGRLQRRPSSWVDIKGSFLGNENTVILISKGLSTDENKRTNTVVYFCRWILLNATHWPDLLNAPQKINTEWKMWSEHQQSCFWTDISNITGQKYYRWITCKINILLERKKYPVLHKSAVKGNEKCTCMRG